MNKKQIEHEFRYEKSQGLKRDNEKGYVPELASNSTGEDVNVELLICVKEEPEPLLTVNKTEVLTENLDFIKKEIGVQEVQESIQRPSLMILQKLVLFDCHLRQLESHLLFS